MNTAARLSSPRLARRRSAAQIDRCERRYTGNGSRAAYSARRANRADRQAMRAAMRAMPLESEELDSFALDALVGLEPDWMAI